MAKPQKKLHHGRFVPRVLLGLAGLGLLITSILQGTNVALFNPKGVIAEQQFGLIKFSVALMLLIGIPTLILLYFTAWKYRESNEKATYDASTHHGKFFVFSLWAIPSVFALILATVMWPAAHKLDQHKLIVSDNKPLKIQVVALRWKWLFIYPEQSISTINYVQVPVDTPIQFELTADETPMSSFWIPQLGGQLYAMTGHINQLNLMASTPGDYTGRTAEINGAGFADMKFITHASTRLEFDQWVSEVQTSSTPLDTSEYTKLLVPSENNPIAIFSNADNGLYDKVLNKYSGSHNHGTAKQ